MTSLQARQKVTSSHLGRKAYLYVRQSTLQQVVANTESTDRQYALRRRAIALGWQADDIVVIDHDLGQSASSAADRQGFQQLVSEVGMGRAGIVLGLEVSRLARNCADWHRLLEICGLTDTLILDEDGIYHPNDFNDRLLLGLKGTMSEAELHMLRVRLRGGILNKARRGELRCPLPVGLTYGPAGRIVLDPDSQVQNSLRHFFQTFRRTGSASATVRDFARDELLFPRRLRTAPNNGKLVWARLELSRALRILHNPRYAGAYAFGRHRCRRKPDGSTSTTAVPRDEWLVLIREHHPGYISWEDYEANLKRLRANALTFGTDRCRGPAREGPALLQGLVVCGRCGRRMTVRYHQRKGTLVPQYLCQSEGIERGQEVCQSVSGADIDDAVGRLLVESMTPMALEVTLAVQDELRLRAEEVDRLRRQVVDRARQEAETARRRYMSVDPSHRLVAEQLEADWNDSLRQLAGAEEEYQRARQTDAVCVTQEQRERVLALASDFPKVWRDPSTPQRDRKRIARLLLEDVTILNQAGITLQVRYRGGTARELRLPRPLRAWEQHQTSPAVVKLIDALLDESTDAQVAEILNMKGHTSGWGVPFSPRMVAALRRSHGLKSRYERLRAQGLLTKAEMAEKLGTCPATVSTWRIHGLIRAHACTAKPEYLYEDPGPSPPTKARGRKLSHRAAEMNVCPERT